MDAEKGSWAVRLGFVGAAIGIIAVVLYFAQGDRYVNPIAGVLLYTLIGYGTGAVIDRIIAWARRR